MPKISVIIPCYNVQDYLNECLDSVLNQTFKDFEVICINDGSTDNSLQILKEYSEKDNRIQLISRSNKGLGATRNEGVRRAKGDYLFFLDSDDWIDPQCLEKLYLKIEQDEADLCLYGCVLYKENEKVYETKDFYNMSLYQNRIKTPCSYVDIKDFIFKRLEAPLKLWRRKFFMDNSLYFAEGVWYEDVISHVKGIILAKRITFVYENLYFYRQRIGSITKLTNNPRILDIFDVYQGLLDFLKEKGLYENLKQDYLLFVQQKFAHRFNRTTPKFRKKLIKNLKIFCRDHPEVSAETILQAVQRKKSSFYWTENDKCLNILFLPIFRLKFNERKGKYILKILGVPVFKWRKHDS